MTLLGTSSLATNDTLALVILAVFAVFGYRISVRHEILRGRTPWGFPSFVWALIAFFFGPLGLLIELVAERTTPPVASRASGMPSGPRFSRPRLAAAPPDALDRTSAPVGPMPIDVVHAPPFGWYPDTTGRHELRYWDGKRWSELVSDGGTQTSDTVDLPTAPPVPPVPPT